MTRRQYWGSRRGLQAGWNRAEFQVPYGSSTVSEKRDYYEVLGVSRDADASELKRAYRKLALEIHPDRKPGDKEAEARFKEASEAYQVLSDPEKRGLYDRFGHEGPRGAGFGSGFANVGDIFSAFGDIFGDLFGGFGGFGGGPAQARGADLETRVELTLAEVAAGTTKEIELRRRVTCKSCGGSGAAAGSGRERCQQCGGHGQVMHRQGFLMIQTTCPICRGEGTIVRKPCEPCKGSGLVTSEESLQVNIPAGVEDGATLRLTGRGEAAPGGGQPGNLYVHLHVAADPRFERDGADLHTVVTLSFPQAALGATLRAPSLDGDSELNVPAGTQPGDTIALRGKGLPRLQGRGSGDLVVHLRLVVPRSISAEQEQALRAYASAGGDQVEPPNERSGFWRKKRR
jgi:molecular chaperone DnaJ